MLRDSLDAIRNFINLLYPKTIIYVNNVPEGFRRPSFYVGPAITDDVDLSHKIYRTRTIWQIVYFATVDKVGNPIGFEQIDVSGKLKTGLMEAMNLTGPSGTVYHLSDIEGGPRDAEVYINLTLTAEKRRKDEQYEIITEINYEEEQT